MYATIEGRTEVYAVTRFSANHLPVVVPIGTPHTGPAEEVHPTQTVTYFADYQGARGSGSWERAASKFRQP